MPPALAERRTLRLVVLCALYAAQGIPYGFVAVTLAAYLAGGGADADAIGSLLAVALLPWSFKWAWAPFVDRFSRSTMGRRRPWILAAQGLLVLASCAMLGLPALREDLGLLGAIVLVQNVFASLQDVAVDALAVDLLPEHERGVANGLMFGSNYLGTIIGGAVLSKVLGAHGLEAALLVEIALLGGIMLLALTTRERRGDALLSLRSRAAVAAATGRRRTMLDVLRDLRIAFAGRSPRLGAALAILAMAAVNPTTALLTVELMQRRGWTQELYGDLIGGYPMLCGLAGCVAGGWLADRLGRRVTVGAGSIFLGATWLAFAVAEPVWGERATVVALACGQELFLGLMTGALFALFMDISWPRVAATQFTAYMSILNLGRTLGSKLAGPLGDALGTAGAFAAFGAAQIAIALLLVPLDPQQNRRELGHDAGADEP